jgi:hypothetical protein
MKKRLEIFMNPLFVGALVILLFNDFFLKSHFYNFITGKLSDITGLFIFPLFWIAFFPKYRKQICIFTALFFIFWKSELSQVIINSWNALSLFNISRVVDYTDLFALPVIFFSYRYSLKEKHFYLPRIAVVPIAVLAFIAFCATSYNNNFTYNRTYQLQISKHEVIERLNTIRKNTDQLPISLDVQRADTSVISDNDTLYFSISAYEHHTDTIYKYDQNARKMLDEIDTIMHHTYPKYDTAFIGNTGFFIMKFEVTNDDDAKLYPGSKTYAEGKFRLSGDNSKSELRLISVYIGGSAKYQKEKDGQDILLKRFEIEIIEKLK